MAFYTKVKFGLFLSLFCTGCIQTKYVVAPGGCQQALSAGEKILVAEAKGISPHQSYGMYQKLKSHYKQTNLNLAYAREEEFDLLAHQINAKNDTSNLAAMQRLGYNYYLIWAVSELQDGNIHEWVSAEEVKSLARQQKIYEPEKEGSKAKLFLELYATKDRKLIYKLATSTTIRYLELPGKKGGRTYYNASDQEMALNKALKKSAKKLQQACHCCL
ncbi:MAG: hypothetical protein JWQ14_923 [Adhaeribacter sp.]|nr:hypothetical protein [Adhaeribacter sp.]